MVVMVTVVSSLIVAFLFVIESFATITPPNYGTDIFGTVILILTLSYTVIGWYLTFSPTREKAAGIFVATGCLCFTIFMMYALS